MPARPSVRAALERRAGENAVVYSVTAEWVVVDADGYEDLVESRNHEMPPWRQAADEAACLQARALAEH